MPRLRELWLEPLFYVREARGVASSDGGLDLCLGNLPSPQEVLAELRCEGTSKEEAEQAKAALTHAADMHPNHPLAPVVFSPVILTYLLHFISSNLNFISISVSG